MSPKDIQEYGEFIKKNFVTLIILIIFLAPGIWFIMEKIYSTRIEMYQSDIKSLNNEIEDLKTKTEGYKDIITNETAGINWEQLKSE